MRRPNQGVIETFDHDFPSFASGVIIPHELYDVKRNDGHVNLGTSHDTGEFACDSIERWWEGQGRWTTCGRTFARQRPPAMAAGLTDHCWTMPEFLAHPIP